MLQKIIDSLKILEDPIKSISSFPQFDKYIRNQWLPHTKQWMTYYKKPGMILCKNKKFYIEFEYF